MWVLISNVTHKRTGNTAHYIDGKIYDKLPYELKINKYQKGDGVYLVHYDEDQNEITDTFHDNVEDAIEQAKFEFGINEDEWVKR